MAKHDRCTICDYSEQYGSNLRGTNPGEQGKVRQHGNDYLCDECKSSIDTAMYHPEPEAGDVEHSVEDE